jgi:UDP-4-keto-D-QuiNAc 4-reductase
MAAERVLVTGASGFLGQALVGRLAADQRRVVAASRREASLAPQQGVEFAQSPELGPDADWAGALRDVDLVIHAAARVHVMRDRAPDPLAEMRRVNLDGTVRLARQAVSAGVRRFIFLSSIKVNGEATAAGQPFTERSIPAPVDPYGQSKLEAEQALQALAATSGMELVIIRPVLVYGPGVKGNFRAMVSAIQRGLPLPVGAIDNRRSLVAVDNLADLIVTCLDHTGAAGETFLVSDGEDLSTPELFRRCARALGRPSRLVPVPVALLRVLGKLAGKGGTISRLTGNLQVEIGHAAAKLGWRPNTPVDVGLRRMAASLSGR